MAVGSELPINEGASALQMAQTIFGDGVTILNATYSGWSQSSGIYTNGNSVAPDLTPSDTGVILSTGRAADVTQSNGDPNRSTGTSTDTSGSNNDADFNALAGSATYDASYITATFIPTSDYITMQFTFASEEYPEYTGSLFNDVVGIWVNGQSVTSPVINVTQINSINQNQNETLFINNTGDDYNTEMDGFTVTLTVKMPVNNGVPNTIKIGIADVGDAAYDSAILIAGNSIQSSFLAGDDDITHFEGVTSTLDVLANDGTGGGSMTITHVNGQAISVNGTVTLSSGHVITLLPNGNLEIDPPASQVDLAANETINFSYTVQNSAGISDSAYVTVTAVPCFARGTRIRTVAGDRRVEDLRVGDRVETRDHGPQPIRWIGSRRVAAEGRFAPIEIAAGTFGRHDRLVVSPQHRVMLTHWMADLMFGEDEVLVAAKDLVNDCSVRILTGGQVEYFHILFDAHQIIWSEGLLTESFLPGPTVLGDLDAEVQEEVLSLFPAIDPDTYTGYGPPARVALRGFEARAMLG